MEQAQRMRAHLERILLVCGQQHAGKSHHLRNMLGDIRLGGLVPASRRIPIRALSRERCLAVRVSSPHENGDTPTDFHNEIDRSCALAWHRSFWRINYACAMQPTPFKAMPDIVGVCDGLATAFQPERIRVVQLAPDQWDRRTSQLTSAQIDGLRNLEVEVISIDARRGQRPVDPGNVRVLADFFDFS